MGSTDVRDTEAKHEAPVAQEIPGDGVLQGEFPDWKRRTAWFLCGQGFSLFGTSLVQYAIVWYITLTTGSGPMMTLSALAGFLPQIVISLFAGVWADRYHRKRLIVASDALIAFSTLVLAILFLVGYKELWLLFLVTGIRSVGTGIQTPAVSAVVPQLVPPEQLGRVNGMSSSLQSAVLLLSPAASGALLSFASLETVFFVDVGTAIVAIAIMMLLHIPMHQRTTDSANTSQIDELKAGIQYARRNLFVRSLLVVYTLCFILVTPVAFLTPLLVARTFGEEVWRLTANEVAYFGGSILGGVAFSLWGGFKRRIYTFALACTLFGVFVTALGLASAFPLYLTIMFVLGLHGPFYNNPVIVLLQEKVEQGMLGRVFSMIMIVASAAMPLAMLVFGPLADIVGVQALLIATGALMAVLGGSIFYNKGLKSVGM